MVLAQSGVEQSEYVAVHHFAVAQAQERAHTTDTADEVELYDICCSKAAQYQVGDVEFPKVVEVDVPVFHVWHDERDGARQRLFL
jgi:hypothetical protein